MTERTGRIESPDRDHTSRLADYLTLVYHEARNVRHLIRRQVLDPEPWERLRHLPTGRKEAWKAMQHVRAEAKKAETVAGVLSPFERRFEVSLAQLAELYGNPVWRNAPLGGNAWKRIVQLVQDLLASLDANDPPGIRRSLANLDMAQHNTGTVADKLSRLDRAIEQC